MTYSDGNAPSALSESIYGKSDRAATLAPKKENETTSDTQSGMFLLFLGSPPAWQL
ncbi:hypothetical protein BO71DRAFT_396561 [Aspergillus ellipticus CBS 707.79]|uniref:Uncharacterized protein n=1 Tax=Aspergillus ellipticus CBS 707.79 TaxID=1448320 RepID=A0A319E8H8_9EURO|nr:hypothetical protein BO71DRAFT_396561 [Aspergillus ellipticus CBS 707.79]